MPGTDGTAAPDRIGNSATAGSTPYHSGIVRWLRRSGASRTSADTVGDSLRYALHLSRDPLFDFLGLRGAQRRNLDALDQLAARLSEGHQARTALQRAVYALHTCDYPVSTAACGSAVELARRCGDRAAAAQGRIHWAAALIKLSEYAGARAQLALALELARGFGDGALESQALRIRAIIGLDTGDYRGVQEDIDAVLAISRQSGDLLGEARALNLAATLKGPTLTST